MNQKGAIKDARSLGTPKMLLLGLQHMFAMFGATILVPILVNDYFEGEGLSVQVTLFCAGVGTLLFHLITKRKVPAFLGSSFAFLGGFSMVAQLDSGIYANMTMGEKLPYACGGIVVAGLLYLVFALIVKLVGVRKVMRLLPPVVTGPIIISIGLSLASSAVNNAQTNWIIAIVAFAVIVIFNIWGKGMFKIIPILMGIVISYIFALVLNGVGMTNADGSAILDFTSVASAHGVQCQPFVWCKFDITAILVMAPIALATMMEHIGDITAISATVDENFVEDPGLHRTLIGDGLATAFAGAIGGPANTTYGENTGVLELSKVHDPKVIRIAAVYAIILSFSPKFAAVIGSMPSSIIGGVSFILYGMISAIGVRNVVENKVDFTKSRNLIIAAVILVVVVLVLILNGAERRIPVQYSKKMVGRKLMGGQSTNIPLKVNTAGVIPVIFASSIMSFPAVIAQLTGKGNGTGIGSEIIRGLSSNNWCNPKQLQYTWGLVLYIVLCVFFAYFYTSITFNPLEVADNIKKQGGFIPGIRPGKPTSDYLTNILNYIIFIGAVGLIIVCVIPFIFNGVFGANVSFGGTSIIIIVGVILETVKQIESQLLVRNYKGFLNN